MAKNEKTSAAIATKASKLMQECDMEIALLKQFEGEVSGMVEGLINTLSRAKRVAASALTQTPDKKKVAKKRSK